MLTEVCTNDACVPEQITTVLKVRMPPQREARSIWVELGGFILPFGSILPVFLVTVNIAVQAAAPQHDPDETLAGEVAGYGASFSASEYAAVVSAAAAGAAAGGSNSLAESEGAGSGSQGRDMDVRQVHYSPLMLANHLIQQYLEQMVHCSDSLPAASHAERETGMSRSFFHNVALLSSSHQSCQLKGRLLGMVWDCSETAEMLQFQQSRCNAEGE